MGEFLVTGAAGFIGSALAKRLLDAGHAVVTIDNLSTGHVDNIPPGCEFIHGDASDPRAIESLADRRFDVMFHLAGQSGGARSFRDPVYDLNANTLSTLLLLQHARASGTPSFVYASSMAVYGQPDEFPVHEDVVAQPTSFYGVGKLASEHYLRISADHGLAATSLRLNNVYGPGQDLNDLDQGMVSIFLGQAVASRRIVVKGSPDRFRDFVHISDVVEAFVRTGDHAQNGYSVFNVATGRRTDVRELIEMITSRLPYPVEVEYAGETPGDQFGIVCSYDAIRNAVGWEPGVALESGLSEMVSWATSAGAPPSSRP